MNSFKKNLISLISAGILVFISMSSVLSSSPGEGATVSKMALITIEGSMQINAAPAAVWSALTDADKVQQWCPYWKDAAAAQPLSKVGQTIKYTDNWGNVGKSVVIYAKASEELRLAHVPDDGSYVCQAKFVLQPKGSATVVAVTEQYSDALDVPTDRDTAAQAKKEIEGYMAALKTIAEKQP